MKARIPQGAGGAGNMNQMMQRMQKMQEEMTRAQAELEEKVYHVSAGGGNIEVEINGKKEITAVTLKPELQQGESVRAI
jgi:DNA-binding YbaB/EbfC family protein